jgi:hypothetical protein
MPIQPSTATITRDPILVDLAWNAHAPTTIKLRPRDNRHHIAPAVRCRFRLSLQRGGSGSRKSIKASPRCGPCRDAATARLPLQGNPFVRSAPSFRPDLRAPRAGARSGGQGWPVFGPPLQRRGASLTAASTAACSIASGPRSAHPKIKPIKPSNGVRKRPSKKERLLTRAFQKCHRVRLLRSCGERLHRRESGRAWSRRGHRARELLRAHPNYGD